MWRRVLLAGLLMFGTGPTCLGRAAEVVGPYAEQVRENVARLSDAKWQVRARAAEALGLLRAYDAEKALIECLADPATEVRTQAALSLGWCGGRRAIEPLLAALDDPAWTVRQSAYVALTNLTGMEFPFDGLGQPAQRHAQIQAWRNWWARVPADRAPEDLLRLLKGPKNLAAAARLSASSTYRGPVEVLVDGQLGPAYWQTKNVPFPQWCELDLRQVHPIARVVVHQYGPGYCMTDFELALSIDGTKFEPVVRRRNLTPPELVIDIDRRPARFVRITSFGSERKLYPTTFWEIEVFGPGPHEQLSAQETAWRQERGARALGVLGGRGATEALLDFLGPVPSAAQRDRPAVRAALRSLGRLRTPAALDYLLKLLDEPMWARMAADALGDFGDRRAVPALLAAYARYARHLDGKEPPHVPPDDQMSFPSEDRMLETPWAIAYALCRLPLDRPEDRQGLARLAPRIIANLPTDYDTFVLYEPEGYHRLTRHLIEAAGLRRSALEHAMYALGQPRRFPRAVGEPAWPTYAPARMATWLPALGPEPEDLPRLLALVKHPDGWVRLYAAKAIGWLGDRRAIEPLAEVLARSKTEAEFGYARQFKEEEFNDPCPRWREAVVRALGKLKAEGHVPLLVQILNDPRNVLEVRHAAAQALGEIGSAPALAALRVAGVSHSFLSVRHTARDALWMRGVAIEPHEAAIAPAPAAQNHVPPPAPGTRSAGAGSSKAPVGFFFPADFDALVFVRGDNNMPNTWQTVEPVQADYWRQTYVVTDEGPSYRPGSNLWILRPPRPDGRISPLTRFTEGYVGEPEVSWDGRFVVFTRREANSLWWHIWIIGADGTGLRQLTHGAYHDVGPAFLPDGRIVFASSRGGIRDEYHGYPCTPLYVMNADGSDMHPIATNIGRDNEPAVLPDGRIVFSRLEVFYSRNKTELTLHAVHPDGTQDMVLYGPERRAFWRNLDHGVVGPDDLQEAPLTHRVLRVSQPQPMPDGRHIVIATQAGLTLVGPRRDTERILLPDFKERASTTPCPLADGSILCASTVKTADRHRVDLGLYRFYPATGRLELVYNDPATAEYEPRPLVARRPPPILPSRTTLGAYTGRFLCASVFNTQEPEVKARGRLVRLVEGVPVVGRHQTHTGSDVVWRNHGGTLGRVLGIAPLAPDGSFYIETPADRLMHFQVLDSDRRVVGNQLTWIYTRPGENRSCAGCHENPHSAPPVRAGAAARLPPLLFLPTANDFTYRAKAWFKGSLPPEVERRTQTVHAVSLLAR